uniref:Nucleoside phosphorylase domain-containing protein n=1 Tax=Monopterus albus TaxID=43700 RepID=A0A3Q3IMZ1_MONAL
MSTIEGSRFSSRAESLMLRQRCADVVNMSTVPEVVLVKEAVLCHGSVCLCYASITMATDYDFWIEHEEALSARVEVLISGFLTLIVKRSHITETILRMTVCL